MIMPVGVFFPEVMDEIQVCDRASLNAFTAAAVCAAARCRDHR